MMIKGHFVGEFDWAGRAAHPTFAALSKAFKDASDVAMAVEERQAQIGQPGTLTTAGVRAEMTKWVQGDGAGVARAKVTMSRIRREIEQRRGKLEKLHPEDMKEIGEIEEALEVVSNAVRAATKEIQLNLKASEFEVDDLIAGTKFAKLVRTVVNDESTGWQPQERIKVKDLERRVIRDATPDEIQNGYFVDEGQQTSRSAAA